MVKQGEAPLQSLYSKKLQKKLVFEFKRNFYEKIGYYPVVITKESPESDELDDEGNEMIPFMSLNDLFNHFKEFEPIIKGNRYSLASKRRYKELVKIRHIYCFIAKSMGYTLQNIAYSLTGVDKKPLDHTTVINAIRNFSNMYETDPTYRRDYHNIYKRIREKAKTQIKDELSTMECGNPTSSDPKPTVFSGML